MAPRGCAARANHGRGCPREARDYRADHVIRQPAPTTRIAEHSARWRTYLDLFEALRLSFTKSLLIIGSGRLASSSPAFITIWAVK